MRRIDISGQFNVDYPYILSSRTPVQLLIKENGPTTASDKTALGILRESTYPIFQDWYHLKKQVQTVSILILFLIILLVMILYILPPHVEALDKSLKPIQDFQFVFFLVVAGVGVFLWIQMRIQLHAIASDLKQVCEECSSNSNSSCKSGIKFEVHHEQWGGCNKPHVKRYYIMMIHDEVAANKLDHEEGKGEGVV